MKLGDFSEGFSFVCLSICVDVFFLVCAFNSLRFPEVSRTLRWFALRDVSAILNIVAI